MREATGSKTGSRGCSPSALIPAGDVWVTQERESCSFINAVDGDAAASTRFCGSLMIANVVLADFCAIVSPQQTQALLLNRGL